jgi:hypothetical protein
MQNPYNSIEHRNKLRPEWGTKIQKLAEDKQVKHLQFRFFVDGYNFYLGCQEEVRIQANYVRSLYKEWAEHLTPQTPTDARVLATIGRELLRNVEESILTKVLNAELGAVDTKSLLITKADHYVNSFEFDVAEQLPYVLASYIALNRNSPEILERIKAASVIIDPYYILDFYAGRTPNIEAMKSKLWAQYKSGELDTIQHQREMKLLNEGKYRDQSGREKEIFEYQEFVESFAISRPLDQVHKAMTRFDYIKGGAFKLSEKGVDAKLMLGLFDALEEGNVDAICLFSNDGDYYPILKRIKEDQPSLPIFVAAMGDVGRISGLLKDVVGEEFVIDVKSRRPPWPEITESKVFDNAQYNRSWDEYRSDLEAEYEIIREDMDRHFIDEWKR